MQEEIKTSKLRTVFACVVGVLAVVLFIGAIYGMIFGAAPTDAAVTASTNGSKPTNFSWMMARYGWCALLMAALAYPLITGKGQKHFRYFRDIRPLMIVQNLAVIAGVVFCAIGLKALFPFLDRSWLYLLPLNNGRAANIMVLPAFIKYFGLVFVALLVMSLPALAYSEERTYRQGTKEWKHGVKRNLRFGCAHCFVGIPLYAGLALSISGLWFTHQFFRGGVDRSTVHHLTYNLLIVTALIIYLVASRIAF